MAVSQFGVVCLVILAMCSVVYSACTTNDIRLQGGATKRQGRVEICRNNQWGTVCDDLWGTADAKVVCNQLNYDANSAIARGGGYFPKGWGKPIFLDNVRCGSGEYKLINCKKNCIGCHNCNHHEDAGAECPACLDGNLWLPGGSTWREGTVEVCYNGVWSTVCDANFGVQEAKVVCTQLGYNPVGAQAFSGAYFGRRYGPVVFSNLACSGSEKTLFSSDCLVDVISETNPQNLCGHGKDAGVRCPVCPKGSIRLWSANPDTPPGEGMLHYCHTSGEWKAMCRYLWGCVDAKVACRDLGFNGSLTVNALYDVDGAYGFWLPVLPQRVQCVGNEAVLKDCKFYYTSWCNHALYETAGVKCYEDIVGHDCTNGDIRLVDGQTGDDGRVEYCFHSEWSPFCQMHDEEASVACKQLGYTDYTIASLFNDERYGTAGYVSDFHSITCSDTASENQMMECDVNFSYGCTINSCQTEYGIKCFNPGMCKDGDVRLVDGNIEQEGRAEVCYLGVWSTICDWGWNALDAHIMCKSLGYDSSISPDLLLDSYFGDGEYPVAMSHIQCGGWEKNILDCPRLDYLSFYPCPRTNLASLRCYDDCTEGEVRLVGGPYENEGTVEICAGGLWGLIADAGWDDNDAQVVCRQAGFPNNNGAVSHLSSYYGRTNKTVHYTNVHCKGGEDTIDECTKQVVPLSDGRLIYLNATVVGVDCIYEAPTHPPCISVNLTELALDGCTDNQIKLVGGDDDGDEGRVDYCIDGRWSPFCIMDEITASIVCKTLGFTDYSWASISINTSYGIVKNYSHFDNISCDASAETISDCTVNDGDCIPYCPNKNIALRCFTPGECATEGEIRLVDGLVDNEGRVEVCLNGVWGGICDDGWDATDAHVVCQQLEHPELFPVAYHNSFFGDGIYPLVYSMMACGGFEDRIGDCDKKTYSEFSCSRDRFAGVLCGQDCENGEIRLQGGPSESEGTVEICIDHVWGNIQDIGFSDQDASLVCQQLGFFADGAEIRPGSLYGKTTSTVHVSDLICYGDESSIFDCSLTIWSLSDGRDLITDPSIQVAGVYCITEDTCIPPPGADTACEPGQILIDNAGVSNEGNLLFCANGTWSPFCSLNGGTASVACKSLGFTEYSWAGIVEDGRYNPTMNISLFQNFTCTGEEELISDCPANRDCISRCTTPYGIQCYEPTGECNQEEVRLANGDIAQEGRVEICIDNVWGAVCGVEWNKIDALIICRQLGLGIGEPWIYTDTSNFGETAGPIIYSNVDCQGWEDNLGECYKASYYDVTCPRSSMAGVVCRDDCQDGEIRLYGGSTDNEGTIIVCKDNFWGLIGQTTWDDRDAKVICRNLDYPTDGAYARLNSYYGKPNLTLSTSSVVCEGDETKLTECKISWEPYASGKVAAKHVEVGGVYCPPRVPPPECETPPPFVNECTNGDTRLMMIDSNVTKGLLQHCYNNTWTYFCALDATEATVACYQLGYKEYSLASIITDGSLGTGSRYSAINSINCIGTEKSLSDCTITSQDDCYPKCTANIAIQCYSPIGCVENTVRLADGGFSQRGRVEHCYQGVWGTVCDNGWDDTDVYSLCRGLGYDGTNSVSYTGSTFGVGTGPAIYSDVACDGTKTDILQCDKSIYPFIQCSPNQLAGALCTSMCNDDDLRLVGSDNSYEGTVEICRNGVWGMISDFNWGSSDARVVCQQLRLPTDDFNAILGSHFGRPDDAVHMSNVGCFGDELKLSACSFVSIDIGDAQVYQNVAGVTCRAKSFNTTSSTPTSTSTATATATADQVSSSDSKTAVTNVVIILGVVVFIAIVAAVVIIVGMIFMTKRRDAKTKEMTMPDRRGVTQPPISQLEKDVINPLAVEAGLDGDDDENTKTLQDLIQESRMK